MLSVRIELQLLDGGGGAARRFFIMMSTPMSAFPAQEFRAPLRAGAG
jgi:hypothetical protein